MSIYRRTDRVPLNDVTVTGTTHAAGRPVAERRGLAGSGVPRAGQRPPPADDRTGRRRCPPDIRPNALLAKFPRIANLIAVLWQDPNSLRRYIDDLLVDKRGNRQGFPLDILRELFALRAYYDELHPEASRPWEVMNNGE